MEAERRPAKIQHHKIKSAEGKHIVHFQVLDKDDLPVKDAIIRILDRDLSDGYYDLPPTDKHGTVLYQTEFQKKERIFTAVILGSSISTWMRLYN